MLILTRKYGQTITIGKDASIKIIVINSKRGQVKIGIQAPRDIPVHREEIYQLINCGKASFCLDEEE